MAYNFLKDARTVKNSELCIHDNLDGYSSDFHENGNIDGWDIYDNIYLYGCWNSVLFGTSYDRECYISRSNIFSIVEAEDYYYIKIMMKITDNSPEASVTTLTTGRIQWTRLGDSNWASDKQVDFEIIADNKWRLYTINMGPAQWWQGDIDNLRIYPFIDGRERDQFAIKFIKISSLDTFACDNTQCSYYLQYSHPCQGAGRRGTCEAGISKSLYTTVSGVSDGLVVNINDYGEEHFTLGNNSNLTGVEMAKIIANKIGALNIGGYAYSFCEYSEFDKLKITSGSVGTSSSVSVSGTAVEALGFYNLGVDVSTKLNGIESADGFDYASSRILTAFEINKLIDGNSKDFAYIHNPLQYSVEGGRRDFNEMGTSQLLSKLGTQNYYGEYYDSLNNEGRTLIDFSHPFNNNGRITAIYMYGVVDVLSKVKILRPRRDGSVTVIHSLDLPLENISYMYTTNPIVYRVDCNVLVEKGDILGIYNANLYVGVSPLNLPEATFTQVIGDVSGTFTPGDPISFGVGGFAIYARGDRWQTNTIIDIDLGDRVNIEEMNFYGKEESEYFEFNIACCEDVNWEVDLFSESHQHSGINWFNGDRFTHTHQNIYYGIDCLDDCIKTADNGQVGTSYGKDSNGVWTAGDNHSYFYVNGDAEWLYYWDCSVGSRYEYCGNWVPYGTKQYIYDPIAFTLKFPYEFEAEIHKSIIYFKNRNNFRDLALSYYLGKYSSLGNTYDMKFRYIPGYTSIRLDGLLYDSTDDSVSNPYIFSNPMSSKPIYARGDADLINWEIVQAAHATYWTIIEHNFAPILCKGFRIYTNHHYSTKITELELYSKMSTSPSLVDNITLSFSDYGDLWTDVSFEEIDSEHINAFIGGAPRYFTLEFESANEFSLNEIEMLVGDQVKTEKCGDIILLDHAKSGVVNESTAISIENVYDKSFDLYVDLPKETSETDNLIFWSKLGSYDQIEEPEIGPGCKLHKQDDYPIRNDNGQCAINVPAYVLKNLVHNKEAYYSYNDEDYIYWGTISSGTSIDFCNGLYMDMHKSEFTFNVPVSSQYWKIGIVNAGCAGVIIKDIVAYYDDNKVDITKVYVSSTPGSSSQLYSFDSDGTNIQGLPGVTDNFDDATYVGTWTIGGTANSSLVESDGKICVSSYGTLTGWIGPTMTADLENDLLDFYLFAQFRIDYDQMFMYEITLQDNVGTQIIRCVVTDSWAVGDTRVVQLFNKANVNITGNLTITITEGTTVPIEVFRMGSAIRVKIAQVDWSGTIDTDVISKIKISYTYNTIYGIAPTEFCTEYISVTSMPMLYSGGAFGFKLNSSDPLNKIKLIHGDCGILSDSIYVSPNNGNNYISVADLSPCTWNKYDRTDDTMELSNGNLTVEHTTLGSWKAVRSAVSKSSGKWYWEIKIDEASASRYIMIGVGTSSETLTYPGDTLAGYGYYGTYGYKYHDTPAVYGDNYTTDDVISVALDLDNGKIWWAKNGTWQASGVPASGTNPAYIGVSGDFYAMVGLYYIVGLKITANFGASTFQHPIPTGFEPLYTEQTSPEITLTADNEIIYVRFAIDLEQRYDLDIIRNYGSADNLDWISTSSATDYSNSVTSDIDSVSWNNSTKNDVRWLRINLINDYTLNCIRKLGIYPDISSVFCQGGGYNCEWLPIGNILSDYMVPLNIAYGATTTGTNYYYSDYYPDNVVDGISTDYRAQACWGFQKVDGVDPYLELDFGQLYLINKVVLYHGYDPRDSSYVNTDYTFSVSTTSTGSFTTVFSTSGNTQLQRTHQFDQVYARRARLLITGYDSEEQIIGFDETTAQYIKFDGCYLREIEVYTYTDVGYIDSETWPIACMDLQDQFNIVGHDVINKDVTDTDTDWGNNDEFFMYSDNVFDDPQKVSFTQPGENKTYYQKTDTFISTDLGTTEYSFSSVSGVYFDEGRYVVEWDAWAGSDLYGSSYPPEEKISLRLDGPATVDHFANVNAASAWMHQTGDLEILIPGFYSVKGIQHIDATYEWGVKNPIIYRPIGLHKWAAVKRDTAENYSYDDDSNKYGADYLSSFRVYGDEKYNPTEYSWWWTSTLSTLENDHLKVRVGAKSLKISYPTSSGVDTLSFIEGDDFGSDAFFESKDMLHFWWYVSDVTKLDVDYGDITFGVINSSDPAYYMWTISGTNLVTGWNDVKLKFEDADYFYPVLESYYALSDYFDKKLDFRNNGKDLSSFRIRYRGKGQSFTMNIDDMKIERNVFVDNVKFGKGLCLTGYDYLEIPLSTITLEKGTIEFWVKLYTDTYGRNKYSDFNSRVLFTLVNNNNDIISLGIKSGVWFEPLSGHIRKALNMFDISNSDLPISAFYNINEIIHLAMVWSNDGSFTDNGDTLRFYINNELICRSKTTWEVEDTKSAILKLGGATTQMALNKDPYGAAVFDNIKIYNYCKDSFDIEQEGVEKDITFTPNEFLEVSKNNIDFYGVGSANLPLIYQSVPAGESRIIYVRADKNDNFKQSKSTATLIIDWLTTV